MKRLILALLLIPTLCFAGVDDSGLQMYKIDGKDMLGMGDPQNIEDTNLASMAADMYNDGNSATQFTYSNASSSYIYSYNNYETYITKAIPCPDSYNTWGRRTGFFAFVDYLTSAGPQYKKIVWYHDGTESIIIGEIPLASSNFTTLYAASMVSPFLAFTEARTVVMGPTRAIALDGNTSSAGGLDITANILGYSDGEVISAAEWKNRLWTLSKVTTTGARNRIRWSSAVDQADFTPAADKGGIVDVPNYIECTKIIATKTALYVVGVTEIWMISGGDKPSSWTLEKIWSAQGRLITQACKYSDSLIFYSDGIYNAATYQVTRIASPPYVGASFSDKFSDIQVWDDRFIIMSNATYSYVFDLTNKTYYKWNEVARTIGAEQFVKWTRPGALYAGNVISIFDRPSFKGGYAYLYYASNYLNRTPIINWRSPWLTLDGVASNLKGVRRVEVDFMAGSDQTMSVYLLKQNTTTPYFITAGYKTFNAAYDIQGNYYPEDRPAASTAILNLPTYSISPRFQIWILGVNSGVVPVNTVGPIAIKQVRIYYQQLGNPKRSDFR